MYRHNSGFDGCTSDFFPLSKVQMLVLTDEDVLRLLTMQDAIRLVEAAFAADADGMTVVFPAIVQNLGASSAHFGLKSSYVCSERFHPNELLGFKAGGYWLNNQQQFGLPNHRATIVMLNMQTGEISSVIAANAITRMRTAAAGAIAARYLARQDAKTVAILGAGEQASAQLEALMLVTNVTEVKVWSRTEHSAKLFAAEWSRKGVNTVASLSAEAIIKEADIVVTTTPATAPILEASWVQPGTHINAIGSDGAGKRELPIELIRNAKFVADKFEQSATLGELQGVAENLQMARSFLLAELGELCSGRRVGRESAKDITIFDSSGIAIQDVVVAGYVERLATELGLGTNVAL